MKKRNKVTLITTFIVYIIIIFGGCSKPAAISNDTNTNQEPEAVAVPAEPSNTIVEEAPRQEEKDVGGELDEYLIEIDFGGVVMVVQGEKTILHKAYGLADAEHNIINTVDTPFSTCSLTKEFTGAAILMLELDGKLNTEDTLDKFFNGYEGLENVSIADLLVMRGGFGNYFKYISDLIAAGDKDKINIITAEDVEKYILENWSGEKLGYFDYSNSDYYLLGRIIEKVSGMAYEEFVQTRLFASAGMTSSGFAGTYESAIPYKKYNGIKDVDSAILLNLPFYASYSAGGINSTAYDIGLWMDAYFGGRLFGESILDEVEGAYNYGWRLRSKQTWWSCGALQGFGSYNIYDRASKTKIVILSNYNAELINSIASKISRDVLGQQIP